jgi:cytochrome o ubiquinol oxidase subunit 1
MAQLYVSIRTRDQRRDLTGDPWDGRTLEWATASPPPAYNFAVMPDVEDTDAFWDMKKRREVDEPEPSYEPIEMPRNTPVGPAVAVIAMAVGFAAIWHIWWLVILGMLGAAVVMMAFGWDDDREFEIPAAEVARIERGRPALGRAA